MKFVYQKTVIDFIKRLGKIHHKYVNLLSSSRLDAKSSMNLKNWVSHDLALLRRVVWDTGYCCPHRGS